ncbi:MAG: EAL domain-containing protein [Desulfitobacteriaceae bacterium]
MEGLFMMLSVRHTKILGIILIFFLPIILDTPDGRCEWIWILYAVPACYLAFTKGYRGAIIVSLIGTFIHTAWEFKEYLMDETFDTNNFVIVGALSVTVLLISLGLGYLTDKLRKQQIKLENAYDAMEYNAHHDQLTGLPNRRLFEDRLFTAIARANRKKNKVALMFVDLDRLKNINDTMGHYCGDLLIKGVAERLSGSIREADTLCRWGGDEFTIILDNLNQLEEVVTVANRIIFSFQEPFLIQDTEINSTVSVGISIYPDDGKNIDDLTKHADSALYKAKEQKNSYWFFIPEMNTLLNRKMLIEQSLKSDLRLAKDNLLLHYQPQVRLITGKVVGAEALLRWNNNELGLVDPTEFIPIAEETGLIIPIGEWVLNTACKQVKQWQTEGKQTITIAVNISTVQLRSDDFVKVVQCALNESGLEPRFLHLEITESAIINEFENVIENLLTLKSMGIGISLDDFGTGYSSLSYLQKLPLDSIKIDRSFVNGFTSNEKQRLLIGIIIAMGKAFNYEVIAEGVETVEQLSVLKELNCDLIQGYFYGKPLAHEDFNRHFLK